jgi:hypothetical protein
MDPSASFDTSKVLRAVRLCLIIVLFASFFLSYTGTPVWDYDFWWHLATGRYIVTEKHLPEKDPFSFTSDLPENKNPWPRLQNLNLKQYWLAQILFYLIYVYTGFKGIIFLRAILLFLTLLVVYRHLRKKGVHLFLSLIFVYLLFDSSLPYLAERPVLFTIFFTAIIFFLLDSYQKSRDRKIFFLIPLMLLWANLHGGFIVGDLFLLIFMCGEAAKIALKKSDYSRHERKLFFGVATAAIVASFGNPVGWDAFLTTFLPKYAIQQANIQEWQSPFFFIYDKIFPARFYSSYLAVMALFPLLLLIRNKRIDLNQILLVTSLWVESMFHVRTIIFFMIPAVIVVACESSEIISALTKRRWPKPALTRIEFILTLFTSVILIILTTGQLEGKKLIAGGIYRVTSPVEAVDFIKTNRVEGNLFNDYGYGGYIVWKLYPWKKDFIDTRALNMILKREYDLILSAAPIDAKNASHLPRENIFWYERLLDHYKIRILLLSQTTQYGDVTPLVLRLMDDARWVPVFCDPMSVVYVRNVPENSEIIRKFRKTNEVVYNSILVRCSSIALSDRVNPRPLLAMGEVFYKMGRLKDSLEAYQYAAKRDPNNTYVKNKIEKLKAEMMQRRT